MSSNSFKAWIAPGANCALLLASYALLLLLTFLVIARSGGEPPALSSLSAEIIYPLAVIPLIDLGILNPVVSSTILPPSDSLPTPFIRKLSPFFFDLPLSMFLRLTCLMLGFLRPGDAKLPIST